MTNTHVQGRRRTAATYKDVRETCVHLRCDTCTASPPAARVGTALEALPFSVALVSYGLHRLSICDVRCFKCRIVFGNLCTGRVLYRVCAPKATHANMAPYTMHTILLFVGCLGAATPYARSMCVEYICEDTDDNRNSSSLACVLAHARSRAHHSNFA